MIFAAKLSEVPNFGKKLVTVNGQELVLLNIKGEIFALENECPHQGSPMHSGIVKESYISCPRHGFRFDLKSGKCLDNPAFTLKLFPTKVEGADIFVNLG